MKLKPRHIRKFEAFIQNRKDQNEKPQEEPEANKPKKKKTTDPEPEEELQVQDEPQDDLEDFVDEMIRYFQAKKNYPSCSATI